MPRRWNAWRGLTSIDDGKRRGRRPSTAGAPSVAIRRRWTRFTGRDLRRSYTATGRIVMATAERPIDRWFASYSGDHRNPTNQLIHVVCVPAIVWSIIALLWCIPAPGTLFRPGFWAALAMRSEEHTSELQSLMRISYAVFCLKKKT